MLSFTLLLCTLLSCSTAFQSSSLSFQLKKEQEGRFVKSPSHGRTSTAIGVAWSMENNDDVQYLFSKAKECAYSEDDSEYSVDDALKMLQDLTFLLSNCGRMAGNQNAVCEDQDVAAEVVARLRVKASSATSEVTVAEESTWKSIAWDVLTKFDVPMAVIYYFACIYFMMQYGEFGVNSVDIDTASKVNELYMSW
mmetsp:Transcript_12982/g.30749  ORF Transcript_12982/g.30749 Transcript_12982/m.30749 type:complete len:195 (+) Transcript_12982:127-711(+)|eukprot:CAMPEP_0113637094 /NCGR_PEP_ID=MMETSP0017_2-20120614/19406_1 /TAXON_ID=2856 /ORGANISM="Cylindrotheca closterium" /LENGTH=194 /DNA_ID=CAMNT_0000548085 /DNA_START=102 /DNA_END=683 /DNA_ORIENTATION=+ /assembly_acc=CAM_ASM_000147